MAPTLTQDLLYLNPDDSLDSKTQPTRDDLPGSAPIENLSEAESAEVLRWARHYAPELLTRLLTAYEHRAKPPGAAKASSICTPKRRAGAPSSPHPIEGRGFSVASGREVSTLKEIEREQIQRVLAESATLRQAASKLGIDETTLWRKRKRYRLH
jgi:DNA-binding NtrC family response regulator